MLEIIYRTDCPMARAFTIPFSIIGQDRQFPELLAFFTGRFSIYLSFLSIYLSIYLSFFLDSLTLQLWRDGKEVEKGLCPTKVFESVKIICCAY
jgi:hypothetical protein